MTTPEFPDHKALRTTSAGASSSVPLPPSTFLLPTAAAQRAPTALRPSILSFAPPPHAAPKLFPSPPPGCLRVPPQPSPVRVVRPLAPPLWPSPPPRLPLREPIRLQ